MERRYTPHTGKKMTPRVTPPTKRASTCPRLIYDVCAHYMDRYRSWDVGPTEGGSTITANKSLSPKGKLFRQNKRRKSRQPFINGKRKWQSFSRSKSPSKAQVMGRAIDPFFLISMCGSCLLYTSPSPRDQRGSRMPSSA